MPQEKEKNKESMRRSRTGVVIWGEGGLLRKECQAMLLGEKLASSEKMVISPS